MTDAAHRAELASAATEGAAALERTLGDPATDASPLSFASSVANDDREAFPSDSCATLLAAGYHRLFVPARDGGALLTLRELLLVGRVVARRDLTTAIATGQTFLGALPVWLDGEASQRARVAELVAQGGSGCLALTEQEHGSDIAANEVAATRTAGGATLSGTKWCINNATRSAFLTVHAANEGEGAGGQSIVLVDKERLAAGSWSNLPKIATHGIRGADISGIRFERAPLDAQSIVGREGRGLDLVLRTLQISRTACAAFSLGAGDTALRLAHRFASQRRLYGRAAYEIPVVRTALAQAFGDLLVADALTMVACRAASLVTGEMSVVSAVVKSLVPELVDGVVREAGIVLGARGYLREGPAAAFQKLSRDQAVVALFDGSTAVNLSILAGQLPRLSDARSAGAALPDGLLEVGGLFDLAGALPPVEWRSLRATARGADSIVGAIPRLARRAQVEAETSNGAWSKMVARLAGELAREVEAFDRAVLANADRPDFSPTDATSFALARRYCLLAAGAACLGVWLFSRDALAPSLEEGALAVALESVLGRLAPPLAPPRADGTEVLSRALGRKLAEHRMLSLLPVDLAVALPVTP